MKKNLFVLLTVLALLLGGAGCSDDDEPAVEAGDDTTETTDASAAADSDGDGDKVAFKTDARKFVDVPSTIKGGFVEVEVENDSKLVHEAAFVRADGGKSQADVVKGIRAASQEQGAPIDPALHIYLAGNIGEIKPGATQTAKLTLPAGEYYLLCALTDADSSEEEQEGEPPKLPTHMEEGMIQKVTVTGPKTVPAPTAADATVTAKEYSFDVKGLTAGKKEVLFVNDPAAKEIHMAAVMEFGEGVDEAAAKKAVEAFSGDGPPPAGTPEPEEAGFSGIFDPGGATYFDLDVKAGRVYAFLCFIQDRAGGPPHVAKGMVSLVTAK